MAPVQKYAIMAMIAALTYRGYQAIEAEEERTLGQGEKIVDSMLMSMLRTVRI